MIKIVLKYFLYFLVILITWVPLLQRHFVFIKEKPLNGAFTPPDKPLLNFKTWFSGEFQEKFTSYTEFRTGFHNTAVRIHNQLNFWTGEQALNVITGKENFLMEPGYINAYLGKNFVGIDSVEKECQRLKKLQDFLNEYCIDFFILIAPSKTRVYPEFIPDYYHKEKRRPGNYEYYTEGFKKYGVNYIDFEKWFEEAKDTSRYPLYTKLGVHWSLYGALLSTDSLLGYMEQLSHRPLNRMRIKGVVETDTAAGTDDDLFRLMNLLLPLKEGKKYAYLQYEIYADPAKEKPSVLAVGDSHYWSMLNSAVPGNFFGDSSAYFYYNTTAFFNKRPACEVKELDLYREVMTKDIVFFIYSDPFLKELGDSFQENFLKLAEKNGRRE